MTKVPATHEINILMLSLKQIYIYYT
jgi:hypothetical protein